MGGDQSNCATEVVGEKEERPLAAGPRIELIDAPILLLVYFHKALRAEFTELRRIAVEASESGCYGEDLIPELRERFEFLELFYKYHSAAEDEVIFLALDVLVKNVVNTYSLEHKSINDLFNSIFHCLDVLNKEDRDISKPFQELVFCIGTIHTTIFQHMLKEEEQVFPLLMQQFSSREQASLIWQFMCSVPVTLLEDFFPWMNSFLSSDEQVEIMHCMKEVVPKEKLLQEVVISWIDNKKQLLGGHLSEAQFLNGLGKYQDKLKVYTSEGNFGENQQLKTASLVQTTDRYNPIDGIHIWHDAIKKDMQEFLVELYQIRISNNISDLASLLVQLNFFTDSLIFYSKALDKIFYPLRNELAKDFTSPCYELFLDERKIEGLQKLLYYNSQCAIPLRSYVEKLCGELESFVNWINKHLTLLETEVFPFISMKCSHEIQQWLLYTSLKMMPLGLLKCMITWFSAHLTEDESKSILNINLRGPLANKSLTSLLCDWVRISYSGKSSIEKFRKDLQEMFNSRCSFLYEQIKEDTGLSNFQLDMQHCNRSNSWQLEKTSVTKNNLPTSSSISKSNKNYDTSYTSGMNFHVFFPQTLKIPYHLSQLSASSSGPSSFSSLESKPMDHIIFFHKALKKDLEYLVFVSAKLAENVGFLKDFHNRFHLLRFFYQMHSDSEDDIAFPALEAKGNFHNISHSYTIDHKLEGEQFIKVSIILDEISNLIASVSSRDVHALDHREPKYGQLCVKLHDMCTAMHKVLCDHIHHEEIELLPLFRKHFSVEDQEKITGRMLGRIGAEVLQKMIPWLMASLTPEEQHTMMSLWRNATKNTKFDEWLGEWWEGEKKFNLGKVEEQSNALPSCTVDPLEVVLKYLVKEGIDDKGGGILCDRSANISLSDISGHKSDPSGTPNVTDKEHIFKEDQHNHQSSECAKISCEVDIKKGSERTDESDQADETGKLVQVSQKFRHEKNLPVLSQEELMAAIRRLSGDSDLDLQSKSFIIQNLLTSRWTVAQNKLNSEIIAAGNEENVPGQCPSYQDSLKLIFGCKHYKRNCKLVSACCNTLYTCRLCHDDVADHSMDRKTTTKMMCMKCLMIQPVGSTCSTPSCHKLSMARYYCRICKLFDDEREIYHCPYCNLCRVGKGLGIDYFHCMNCNACMSRSLSVHICREKCFEDFCPICHEFIFTSSSPVKALPCGHLMHSACFQAYTCSHYTCPICSKSLGDMQVYFGMLDALLAEEKLPLEHAGQTQVILCNDCEKRGNASFHWLYHKCPHCGSYNTRLL